MKRISITLLFVFFFASIINAQTSGTLTVTVTTSEAGGSYQPRNIVAVWIEDDAGNFVKTMLAYAQNRITHLNTWEASTTAAGSPFNVVDAITGATRPSHNIRISTWDGTDINGILMPDGTYHVCMELTDKNSTGNYSSFVFEKSESSFVITPLNVPSFSSIEIKWGTLDIEFVENTPTIYPNGQDITLDINVIDEGEGIDKIEFYVDDVLEETDETAPYGFTYSYADGQHTIKAVAIGIDGSTDEAQLIINVGTFTITGTIGVIGGNDDVEETEAGLIYANSSDLEMVYDSYEFVSGTPNGFQIIGLRFQNVNIPPGSIINNAYIQFRSDESNDQTVEFLIFAEDAADAVPFSDNPGENVSGRIKLSGSVAWSPPAWTGSGLIGPEQQTPELNNFVQQIIDRPDWQPGNSMVFAIEGTGVSLTDPESVRVADSFEGSEAYPPTLVYTYTFEASVGLQEKINSTTGLVFPVPFTDELNIQLPRSESEILVKISDISGRLVYLEKISPTASYTVIKPGIIKKGIYIISAFSSDNTMLLKQKIIRK